ncbi:MAG: tRNA (N6-threonylcarbamoyladenosine(37)-N6)-methyltransferase TrmO [Promethearchaeota archaeon]
MKDKEIIIRPIGNVRVEGEDPMNANYYLDIHEQYRSALKALDKFSHVIVLWWAHQNDTEEIRGQVPPYGENPEETGIFATRAEYRPNPIAMTTTNILDVDENKGIVKVGGLDAFDGTPLVDLKVYFPICDRVRDCHIASWLKDWPEWLEDGIEWWQEQGFFDD